MDYNFGEKVKKRDATSGGCNQAQAPYRLSQGFCISPRRPLLVNSAKQSMITVEASGVSPGRKIVLGRQKRRTWLLPNQSCFSQLRVKKACCGHMDIL